MVRLFAIGALRVPKHVVLIPTDVGIDAGIRIPFTCWFIGWTWIGGEITTP